MTILVPNTGEVIALSYLVGKTTVVRDLIYRLFSNNITPAETDTAVSYTETTGGGYAQKALTGANWTVTGGAPSSASYAQQDWTFTGAVGGTGSIYGYYALRATDLDLVLAETFAVFAPSQNGDKVLVTPTITAD